MIILLLLGLFNFGLALAFTSLYFKGQRVREALIPLSAYLFFNLLLLIAGVLIGNGIENSLNPLAAEAGAALMLVVAFKLFIKAIKTKTINRIFDISQIPTVIGLTFMLNIDTLLAAIGLSLIQNFQLLTLLALFGSTALAGVIAGFLTGKYMQFIMSNILEIIAAIALMIVGIASLF